MTGDFPIKCFYWEIMFLRTKMSLPSVTVKKINHPKLTTEQEILRRHVIGYGTPTVCSTFNTCGAFQSDSCTALPHGRKQPSGSRHKNKGLVTLELYLHWIFSFRLSSMELSSLKPHYSPSSFQIFILQVDFHWILKATWKPWKADFQAQFHS